MIEKKKQKKSKMSIHNMLTMLKKKSQQGSNLVEASQQELQSEPVQLTEDLMYMVNKKLKSMDKKSREEKLKKGPPPFEGYPFTKVRYRNKKPQVMSQTEFAVMHSPFFISNAIAVSSTDDTCDFYSALQEHDQWKFLTDYEVDVSRQEAPDLVRYVT